MDDILYREIILEHWKHPQNYGVIDGADIDVSDSNPLCGDEIRITCVIAGSTSGRLSVNKPEATRQSHKGTTSNAPTVIPAEAGILTNIKFTCQGCAISKASGSILTEIAQKKPVRKIVRLSQEEYLQLLEVQLTATRLKCALLPYSALMKGLTNFAVKS